MAVIIIEQNDFDSLKKKVEEIYDILKNEHVKNSADEWLTSREARQLLGISCKTWQQYRDRRVIPFSQHGRKIYVKRADVVGFLERHSIKGASDN